MFEIAVKNQSVFWRYLTNFWAVVLYVVVFYDFLHNNALIDYIGPLAAIYLGILTIYASDKEFQRWYRHHSGRHPGEIFVIMWSLLILGIIIANFILVKSYKLPTEVISVYIAVLTILAVTKKSKSLYKKRRRR